MRMSEGCRIKNNNNNNNNNNSNNNNNPYYALTSHRTDGCKIDFCLWFLILGRSLQYVSQLPSSLITTFSLFSPFKGGQDSSLDCRYWLALF